MEKTQIKWGILAGLMFVVMLGINGIAASTTILGGMTTAEVSDNQPNLFAPAGFTFAIWSVIYLALLVFMVRVSGIWKTAPQRLGSSVMTRLLQLFTISSIINIVWIFAWQYEVFWLSVVLIVGLLVTLVKINTLLDAQKLSVSEAVAVRMPFRLYFGWITIATIANIVTWLVSMGWNGGGIEPAVWMVILLFAGAVIVSLRAARVHDVAFLAVAAWAYFGILGKHISENGFDNAYPVIVTVASLLTLYFVILAVNAANQQIRGISSRGKA